jgi:hypothetical protein
MGAELAKLGRYAKTNPKSKVYYVNRLNYPFTVVVKDDKGKPQAEMNPLTNQQKIDKKGMPVFQEHTVMFTQWITRFTDLGYWSIFEVLPSTPKFIAEALKESAKSRTSEIMDEKKFIEHTNPALAEYISENDKLKEENELISIDVEDKKKELSSLEEQIEKLKKKAGV